MEESTSRFPFSTWINYFLLEPDQPTDSHGTVPIFEIRVLDHCVFVPNFLSPCMLQPQIIVSEVRILLEQPIQLSAPGRHDNFACPTEFAHFPNLDLFFLSTKSLQYLHLTHYLAPVYLISWFRLQATAGCRLLMKTLEVLRGCACGGEVLLDVEAVSPRIGVCSLLTSMKDLGS